MKGGGSFTQESNRWALDAYMAAVTPAWSPEEMAAPRPEPGPGKPCPLSDADCEFTDTAIWLMDFNLPVSRRQIVHRVENETGMLSLLHVSQMTGINVTTLQRRCVTGALPSQVISGMRFVTREAAQGQLDAKEERRVYRNRKWQRMAEETEKQTGWLSVITAARHLNRTPAAIRGLIDRKRLVGRAEYVNGKRMVLVDPASVGALR